MAKRQFGFSEIEIDKNFPSRISTHVDWKPQTNIIEAGDILKASHHAGIELIYTGKRLLLLRGPGEVQCLAPGGSGDFRLKLSRGRLEVSWLSFQGKPSDITILTDNCRVTTRNGVFRLRRLDDGRTILEILEGAVDAVADGQEFTLEKNQGLIVKAL